MNYKEILGSNYKEDMTAEEVLKALEDVDIEKEDENIQKLKQAVTKANREAADYKKQLNARLSEEEQTKAEEQEAREKLQNAYDELLKKSTISENTAKFIGLGYDEKLANQTAKALYEGNLELVFENQKIFNQGLEAKIKEELLNKTPAPDSGNAEKSLTVEDLRKMSVQDRIDFANNNPEQYKQIYGGNE